MASLLSKIKNDAKKAGSNKSKIFYSREGEKRRIRFLNDFEEGLSITFHDSFELGVNAPCREHFNESCDNCDRENLRTRIQYIWSVWDYDAKEVKLFMFAMNNCSPLPILTSMYENYGTINDRDYIINVNGKGGDKSYTLVPMDKAKFRNDKAKPLSEKTILQILDKAFPCDDTDEDEDDEEKPAKKSSVKKSNKLEIDYKDTEDYSEMNAKELYILCKSKDIEVKPKKDAEYYIEKLEEYDIENGGNDDDDDDDADDWNDEGEIDYSEMDAKELYKLCKERDIEVQPKKAPKYYINLLEENDTAEDDWGE